MPSSMGASRLRALVAGFAASALFVVGVGAAAGGQLVAYNVYPLVSNSSAVTAPLQDPLLVNGWGLSASSTSPWWTANNETNSSTLYSGAGSKSALDVTVPGGPTGTVANATASDFVVSQNGVSASAKFLFDTQGGQVLGWAPTVNATAAVTAVDDSSSSAVFDGLTSLDDQLYAADFHNAAVDVFNSSFVPVPGGFKDPNIPAGWAPFGIQALNGDIFVTYAKQDSTKKVDVAGGGLGYVDEYTPQGALIARVASKGNKNAPLNAPWGLALAPSNFGAYSGDLLVGNFGNGRINAYEQLSNGKWAYKGQLRAASGTPIVIQGLWAIAFGNGASAGPTNDLYFISGPSGETQGLFGFIAGG
jgi:uncharacterized protein (TIGR03118 family)